MMLVLYIYIIKYKEHMLTFKNKDLFRFFMPEQYITCVHAYTYVKYFYISAGYTDCTTTNTLLWSALIYFNLIEHARESTNLRGVTEKESAWFFIANSIFFIHKVYLHQGSSLRQLHIDGGAVSAVRSSAWRLHLECAWTRRSRNFLIVIQSTKILSIHGGKVRRWAL